MCVIRGKKGWQGKRRGKRLDRLIFLHVVSSVLPSVPCAVTYNTLCCFARLGKQGLSRGKKTLQKNTSRHVTALARVGWGGGWVVIGDYVYTTDREAKRGGRIPIFLGNELVFKDIRDIGAVTLRGRRQ